MMKKKERKWICEETGIDMTYHYLMTAGYGYFGDEEE